MHDGEKPVNTKDLDDVVKSLDVARAHRRATACEMYEYVTANLYSKTVSVPVTGSVIEVNFDNLDTSSQPIIVHYAKVYDLTARRMNQNTDA